MLVVEESPVIYDSLFVFMATSEDEKEKEVTLFDNKDNVYNYSTKRIKEAC